MYCQAACWVKLPLRGNLSVFLNMQSLLKHFQSGETWPAEGCLPSWNYLYYIFAIVAVSWSNTYKNHHPLLLTLIHCFFTLLTCLTFWSLKGQLGNVFSWTRFSDLLIQLQRREIFVITVSADENMLSLTVFCKCSCCKAIMMIVWTSQTCIYWERCWKRGHQCG